MNKEALISEFRYNLRKYKVRKVQITARRIGVKSPTGKNFEAVIDEMVAVLTGKVAPVVRSGVGKPVQHDEELPEVVELVDKFALQYASLNLSENDSSSLERVETGEEEMARRFEEFNAQRHTMRVEDPFRHSLPKRKMVQTNTLLKRLLINTKHFIFITLNKK